MTSYNTSSTDYPKKFQQELHHPMLRKLGLIGGLSWHSTLEYYTYLNQSINEHFGNNTNPPLVLLNLDQYNMHQLQKADRWDTIAIMLIEACDQLYKAGASAVMFCANTPHKVYHDVQPHSMIPILHIGDAIGNAVRKKGLCKVGLIGTIFTMEEPFIAKILKDKYDIDMMVPDQKEDREKLHTIIQKELSLGILKPETKKYILDQVAILESNGAEGIILGCTEFPLIIGQNDLKIPVFNTTLLHAQMGVDFILGSDF
ncbi:aspartate racemase [Chryseobacterium bernardetii]|uniref:Aspartate racemase n=2 Tax=Chryseobacterium TaxID=59732 RepID=A0A543EMN0_9FLAO|nr:MULTISPECIES: amino acid racemase [Chryseobacterium]MDR6369175.1 aspartate racemase [Chryseobacterium vietnamense]MDR6439902.1 aspartate racemase [Chryseobacterium bernardetii]TQM22779.1 aspartate racemase [Chryseobacterium aquifrigidense]